MAKRTSPIRDVPDVDFDAADAPQRAIDAQVQVRLRAATEATYQIGVLMDEIIVRIDSAAERDPILQALSRRAHDLAEAADALMSDDDDAMISKSLRVVGATRADGD
jgi:hypothetical protein